MNLWIVQARDGLPKGQDPFGCDCYHGFVIRAETEADARMLASSKSADEGAAVWLSPDLTSCEMVAIEGEPGIILSDFNAG